MRALRPFIALSLLVVVCGCNDTKKLQAQVTIYKSEVDPEMQLMSRHTKFLKKKVDTVSTKIDRLESEAAQVGQELDRLTAEPQLAKRDILAVVDAKSDSLATFQKMSLHEFGQFLNDRDLAVRRTLDAEADTLRKSLAATDEFVRFVFAEQDSVNREFAQRFDQKPWYTSILGRWEQHQASSHH